jgi:hypothetical protein
LKRPISTEQRPIAKQISDESDYLQLVKLPGEGEGVDDQIYQLVPKKYLFLSKRELVDIIKELQAALELLHNNQLESQRIVKRWLDEAAEDQRKIELQSS